MILWSLGLVISYICEWYMGYGTAIDLGYFLLQADMREKIGKIEDESMGKSNP